MESCLRQVRQRRNYTGQVLNDQNKKQVWSAAGGLVIVIYLLFDVCDLEFQFLQSYNLLLHEKKTVAVFSGNGSGPLRARSFLSTAVFQKRLCFLLRRRPNILIHTELIVRIPLIFDFHQTIPDLRRVGLLGPILSHITHKVHVGTLSELLGGTVEISGPSEAPLVV